MRSHWLILTGAAMLAGTLAISGSARDDTEVARLRAHFDSVDAELRHRTVPGISPVQKSSRATLIGWLREYRDAGIFPRNDRFTQATPFFRDGDGVLCAMAYLIHRSGRGDLVNRIAATQNNAFIAELADDPALGAWLDSVGLSVNEAARIQPSYGIDVIDEDRVSTGYAVTSVLISGVSLATLGMNMFTPTRSTGIAGVLAGSASAIAGAVNLDGNDGTETVAAANIVIGAAAVAAGVYRLAGGGESDGFSRKSTADERAPAITPVVMQTSGGARVGLAMQANF